MNLFNEFEYVEMPSNIAEDNAGAIFYQRINRLVHKLSTLADVVRYHIFQEKVKAGDIS